MVQLWPAGVGPCEERVGGLLRDHSCSADNLFIDQSNAYPTAEAPESRKKKQNINCSDKGQPRETGGRKATGLKRIRTLWQPGYRRQEQLLPAPPPGAGGYPEGVVEA